MKRLTFSQSGPSRDTAHSLECLVLDGKVEADRAWIKSESGLEGAAQDMLSTAPVRSGRSQAGSSTILSLVRTEDANSALIGVSLVIEPHRLLAVCYGAGTSVESALARHSAQEGSGSISRLLPVAVTALVRPLEPEVARLADTIDDLEDKAMSESEDSIDDFGSSVV